MTQTPGDLFRKQGLLAVMQRYPGAALLPLRLFLGVTFTWAGIDKLSHPVFFSTKGPGSLGSQLTVARTQSPLRGLLGPVIHHPLAFGALVAIAELAVGLGTLLGLWTRIAATGGALLSLSFFLTVSWSTTPYYYGADIVFLFAWLPIIAVGAGGVLALDSWRSEQPVAEASRRALLATAAVGAAVAVLGGLSAVVGQLRGQLSGATRAAGTGDSGGTGPASTATTSSASAATNSAPTTGSRSATTSPSSQPGSAAPTGKPLAKVSQVPVGGAYPFQVPGTGEPAYLLQPKQGKFLALSRICTHAGCEVNFRKSQELLICPCHGGVYDATSGAVEAGPPPQPLPRFNVQVSGDTVYLV